MCGHVILELVSDSDYLGLLDGQECSGWASGSFRKGECLGAGEHNIAWKWVLRWLRQSEK